MDAVAPAAPRPAAPGRPPAALAEAAREVEAIFLHHLLATMRRASGPTRPGPGTGPAVYQDLLDVELARTLARGGGLGLADLLIRDLTRRPAGGNNPSSPAPSRPMRGDERLGASGGDVK